MLEIKDFDQLLALNRALMEARYLARDVDDATRGSAPLAAVHSRVLDAIQGFLRGNERSQELHKWSEWRRFENRQVERPAIVEYLRKHWASVSSDEIKRAVIRNQLQPFLFTEADVDALVEKLDSDLRPTDERS